MNNMKLSHRPAIESDYENICGFAQTPEEVFFFCPRGSYPLTPEALQTIIEKRKDPTIATLEGHPVAFSNFYEWGDHCAIGNLIVAPYARGKGVASYLVNVMKDIAFSKHNATEIRLACFNHNTPGLLLYPKLGFQPYAIGERIDHTGARVAEILLSTKKPRRRGLRGWLTAFGKNQS
ncbi:GNAT family N-acetyltransferase [Oleidesulfovibrio sp.]|uniref:GNAT family N-acetyltransferase n=1 Tax=Oleidesulfovibrio sp. TaxID=2909707 RepID=UPI003A848FB7